MNKKAENRFEDVLREYGRLQFIIKGLLNTMDKAVYALIHCDDVNCA